MAYKAFKHQDETNRFLALRSEAMIGSSPGTGKTYCIIRDIDLLLSGNPKAKVLVIAPKSLLYSAWQDDFIKFAPHIITSVATAPTQNRKEAFEKPANVYITNTDAVKWLYQQQKKNPDFLKLFKMIVIDESGFFMNNSARTAALLAIRDHFTYARMLNGTLTGGPVSNLFYQYYFLAGARYTGKSYEKFKNMTMIGKSKPNFPQYKEWTNKPGIEKVLAKLFRPITIRYDLTDVVDMPARVSYTYKYTPNKKIKAAYKSMKQSAKIMLQDAQKQNKQITAINASATNAKLAQIAAGSIYEEDGTPIMVDPQRFDLVIDLILQYKDLKPLVFFNYQSQRKYMMEYADKAGLKTGFIDGTVTKSSDRTHIVDIFQAGHLDALFLNPLAASHGLTLTASKCSIWSVPIYRGDIFIQAQHRNFRIGQKDRVISLFIEAKGTLEIGIYTKLKEKVSSIEILNDALK